LLQLTIALPFFLFNDTATPELSPLSLHDALPICHFGRLKRQVLFRQRDYSAVRTMNNRERLAPITLPTEEPIAELVVDRAFAKRSEEHTSELQSLTNLVCPLLL